VSSIDPISRRDGVLLEGVTLRRGDTLLFDGLTLALTERRVGLIGRNGSGKSTLLRLAHGLMMPDSGRVTTAGLDTAKDRKLIPSRVGFLFQNPDRQIIFPTVGEEIAFGFEERGLSAKEARARAIAALAAHGCAGWEGKAVHELSQGQKQLVCLVAVAALEPRLILLDEPFSSLDLATRLSFGRQLLGLGSALVMASHDLDLLSAFDRIIWLDEGKVRADGSPAEVLPPYQAEAHAVAGAIP